LDGLFLDLKNSFEDSAKISHVENIMEFGWCWKESRLYLVPELNSGKWKLISNGLNVISEFLKDVLDDRSIDDVNIKRQDHVEGEELPF